jgi:hypothetical protein
MKTTSSCKQSLVKVRSALKGGRLGANHNPSLVKVRSALKGGRLASNHNPSLVRA